MADTFLTEEDYVFHSNNDLIKQKAEAINNHTSLVLLDLSDEDSEFLKQVDEQVLMLKEVLFLNTDKLLELSDNDTKRVDLSGFQQELLEKWMNFGFTEGFFYDMYNVERGLRNNQLTDTELERLELLQAILNEQQTLVMAFNVVYSRDESVILDIDDYM